MEQNYVNYVEKFNRDLRESGLNFEFKIILDNSAYVGSVLVIDLRTPHLAALGINTPKMVELQKVFADYACVYEQMNTLILLDEPSYSYFFSTYEICRLLCGKSGDKRFEWMGIFNGCEPRKTTPKCAENRDDSYACIHIAHVPEYFMKYSERIYGAEKYLPHILYFVLEDIYNGMCEHASYPLMYKNEGALEYPPKTVAWHRLVLVP